MQYTKYNATSAITYIMVCDKYSSFGLNSTSWYSNFYTFRDPPSSHSGTGSQVIHILFASLGNEKYGRNYHFILFDIVFFIFISHQVL